MAAHLTRIRAAHPVFEGDEQEARLRVTGDPEDVRRPGGEMIAFLR